MLAKGVARAAAGVFAEVVVCEAGGVAEEVAVLYVFGVSEGGDDGERWKLTRERACADVAGFDMVNEVIDGGGNAPRGRDMARLTELL